LSYEKNELEIPCYCSAQVQSKNQDAMPGSVRKREQGECDWTRESETVMRSCGQSELAEITNGASFAT